VKRIVALVIAAAIGATAQKTDVPPAWAYPGQADDSEKRVDGGALRRVPDSSARYTTAQVRDLFFAPDWHPVDHPAMPEIVVRGRKPDVAACGVCHRADGPGGPENSSVAGLPEAYIVQQVADFKSGARKSSALERGPVLLMTSLAKAATDAEIASAAAYFSSIKPRKTITVVETDFVPKTYVAGWFLAAAPGREREPIGRRIIEVPQYLERFESRDTRSQFIAYVPTGSVAKGEALATTGGDGKTLACGTCHGPGLRGLGVIPSIAGRSPSYVVRQLYDIQHGKRAGAGATPMVGVVAKLDEDDLISLAAYAASLNP
jgi:cytochrome c553